MTKTPWFNPNIDGKPVRKGVYQTRLNRNETDEWYNYWDGKSWHVSAGTVKKAHASNQVSAYGPNTLQWRGILKGESE